MSKSSTFIFDSRKKPNVVFTKLKRILTVRKAFYFLLLFDILGLNSAAQKSLTQQEILKAWNTSSRHANADSTIVDSDSLLEAKLRRIVDTLRIAGVDSLVIISTAYPGYTENRGCGTSPFPIKTFIIYRAKGSLFLKKLQDNCDGGSPIILSGRPFEPYLGNQKELEREFFMPRIYSARLNASKKIDYSSAWTDHEPNYSFFYFIGNSHHSFQFTKSDLQDGRSLFHTYNSRLVAKRWWDVLTEIVKPYND